MSIENEISSLGALEMCEACREQCERRLGKWVLARALKHHPVCC